MGASEASSLEPGLKSSFTIETLHIARSGAFEFVSVSSRRSKDTGSLQDTCQGVEGRPAEEQGTEGAWAEFVVGCRANWIV